METKLSNRAKETYLWVSLAYKRLEGMCRDQALKTIQELPPGLPAFYRRIFDKLRCGESVVVERCLQLLKAMMLAYRPLDVTEVYSVTGFSDWGMAIEGLVDRCASFIKMRGSSIEFIHLSARDYLAGKDSQLLLGFYDDYGHNNVTLSCVTCLSEGLKVNLVELLRPDSTKEFVQELKDEGRNAMLASMDYAVTFWVQHLKLSEGTPRIQNALTEQGEVSQFLHTKKLEWLECLSL